MMFRLTTSDVAAGPTPLETGITPIPPLKLARVSSAMTEGAKSPTSPVHTKTLIIAHMISFEGLILNTSFGFLFSYPLKAQTA